MSEKFALGDKVRHVTDPHGRPIGTVVASTGPRGREWLIVVEWESGVRETIHPSELRKVG